MPIALWSVAMLAAAAAGGTPLRPIGDPGSWITEDDYPKAALAVGAEGVARFTLRIDATGAVADCTVTESSGNATLDEATCVLLTARGRFAPALDENRQPIEGRYRSQVRWQIPIPAPFYSWDIVTEFDVDAAGRPQSCVTTGMPSMMPPAAIAQVYRRRVRDPCDVIVAAGQSQVWIDGRRVPRGGHVVLRSSATVTPAK